MYDGVSNSKRRSPYSDEHKSHMASVEYDKI